MNFKINKGYLISDEFLKIGVEDFYGACLFVSSLDYKRNKNKTDISCIFYDNGGTCSTKHAVLRKLAIENGREEIKLMLGIFKMDANYALRIKEVLEKNKLNYIPEAHNYLKINDNCLDFTLENSDYSEVKNRLVFEIEIEYNQINDYRINIHKNFLKEWIKAEGLDYSLDEVWKIREECIQALQD
ncbi:hypothetical protein [Riemerella anatipestifer]|uniref:Uncharacterized protein n=1 Tax=Riemerella anatipestifer RA-CH-1 TaxID=1228997 RepID=J9R414_RIEAN|nr:hypothetical protein [Riemerella anatipestifer]AFR36604.1 hypothetical protein B739_2022 [Riemerella anatipestifer RA-CH-1]MCO7331364.1 hypothetical protein [Riemerella anatipestifer]MCO7350165.1 hypothetical protein [Riemerella anatipestifer]MCU7582159.1 hypothetical protein [Riemerella anatipestifer]MCW0492250.1 hypothetical protein [Riemerella anatipestifer]